MKRVALGVRVHSGWAVLVAVAANRGEMELAARQRLVIAEPKMRGGNQPYHFAAGLGPSAVPKFLETYAAACERQAAQALRAVAAELTSREYRIAGCAILLASGRPLPALDRILSSHPLIHTAEGEFFRNTVRRACERLGIRTRGVRQRDLNVEAAAAFGKAAPRLERSIQEMGRAAGPPWTSDQKAATLAAWLVLADPSNQHRK